MAIIIFGKSVCPLCGNLIKDGQKVIAFSQFVSNELDPLWIFNDGAFHERCFYGHPLAEEAQTRFEELREKTGPGNRFCVVCKREILNPDDYFAMGHLVKDVSHPLYNYNYIQAHNSCLPKWEELGFFIGLLEELNQSGAWRGVSLEKIITELNNKISGN